MVATFTTVFLLVAITSAKAQARLVVTGLRQSYTVGDDVSLNCSTDLLSTTLSWQDGSGNEISSSTNASFLSYSVNSVTMAMDQMVLSCRSYSPLGNQTVTVTLTVEAAVSERRGSRTSLVLAAVLGSIAVIAIVGVVMVFICCNYCQWRYRRPAHGLTHGSNCNGNNTAASSTQDGEAVAKPVSNSVNQNGGVASNLEEQPSFFINEAALSSALLGGNIEDPIPADEFPTHVENMHMDMYVDINFDVEFQALNNLPEKRCDVGSLPVNKSKNYSESVLPYDESRVVLKVLPGVSGSDYINASYIDASDQKRAYIATQGPVCVNTTKEFWRMVWENKVTTVVMLSKCYEEGKKSCHQYWPGQVGQELAPTSDLTVLLQDSTYHVNFQIREMVISCISEPAMPPLMFTHYQFLTWPGTEAIPFNPMAFVQFVQHIRKCHPLDVSDAPPLLVHCSSGVGRTGVFIAVDQLLGLVAKGKGLNVFTCVRSLRQQRMKMVETQGQYEFIYDALTEHILCGDTEILRDNMADTLERLMVVEEKGEGGTLETELQKQFELLDELTCGSPNNATVYAKDPCNARKNRYSKRLPNCGSRVKLRPTGEEGSDYINASFIDGYRKCHAYICTQGCLVHTVGDLWRMVYENRCKAIVMLCQLQENNKDQCAKYWEDRNYQADTYGKIKVVKKSEKVFPNFVVRKFEAMGPQPKSLSASAADLSPILEVHQYHYLDWPEEAVPESSTGILQLIDQVAELQESTGHQPILVMCNDGMGRSGTFIGIHSQLQRMTAEGKIDLFQFIKAARAQRAGLLPYQEQYDFCHRVIADCVKRQN